MRSHVVMSIFMVALFPHYNDVLNTTNLTTKQMVKDHVAFTQKQYPLSSSFCASQCNDVDDIADDESYQVGMLIQPPGGLR